MLNSKINNNKHFDGLTFTVPTHHNDNVDPQHHSVVGQKFICVDWHRMFGLKLNCDECNKGWLKNDRTNFSKNRILFPICDTDGPPTWCSVQSMVCTCCKRRVSANSCKMLHKSPAHARLAYPVETKHALDDKNSHLGRGATQVMDLLMPTCGNGDLISQLLCNALNRACVERVEHCCSSLKRTPTNTDENTVPCLQKDGDFIKAYPPLGDGIRDAFDAACSNSNTPWFMSDHDRHDRHDREI